MARALALAAALAVAVTAHADAVIHVRARLRLDLDGIERVPGGLYVRGSLREDLTEEPVPGRTVAISVEGPNGFWHYAEPTAPDGTFRWRVPLPLGTYRLRIVAGGYADYVPAAALVRDVDVGRRTPTVTLALPARVAAHAPSMHAVVEAQESDGLGPPRAYDGPVFVTIDGGKREAAIEVQNGHGEADLFGPFGRAGQRIQVTAAIHDDGARNTAQATRTITLTSPTTVSLSVGAEAVAPDKNLYVAGELHDDDGAIAGAGVVVGIVNGADVATFTTDAHGRYAGWIRGRDLGAPGSVFVEARYRPGEDWRDAAVSTTVAIELLPPPPITIWPYLLSPALTLLAALIAWAVRDRRWLRVVRLRRRARRLAAAPPPAAGLTESRRGILASLRRPDHGLSGVVVDASDERAIPTATVVARTADGQAHSVDVDERGRFAFAELAVGAVTVEIAAPGYVGERFVRTLPHRGELRNARVRLVPVRARIFDAWRKATQPLRPAAAETMTPRELYDHVARRRMVPDEKLATLTSLVESAVWGASAPTTDDLAQVERLAAELHV